MKQLYFFPKLIIILFLIEFPFFVLAQERNVKEMKDVVSFVENKGQFDGRNWQRGTEIEYGIDRGNLCVFFTKKGLSYRFDKLVRKQNVDEHDPTAPKRINISELIQINWLDANEDIEIIAEDISSEYYSYAIKDPITKIVSNKNEIKAYKKLTYKNIYDHIDIEYVLYPETGLKYSFILHPGADVSKIKMKYDQKHTNIRQESITHKLDESGNLVTSTSLGKLVETNPVTYYKESGEKIESDFRFENNILSFDIENYDGSKTIVIDPWVQSPSFNTSNAVWEVETDGSGNVYAIGGETPMKLKKYDIAGNLQWTYNTPWDTNTVWLGTLATDDVGFSYITSGVSPEIERINPAGGMDYHENGGGLLASDEYWSIAFNCDKTKLIIGGTKVPSPFDYYSAIYDIDINTGQVLAYVTMDYMNFSGIGATPIEVRSISSSKNAKYVYLTHLNVGAISQNIGVCPTDEPIYHLDNNHHLGYKCENYLPASQNGGGLKAIVSNDQFFYTHSGDKIYKRSLTDGSLITSVNLPGGGSSTVPFIGGLVVDCSGLAVDNCGNVYAGATDRIVKFDPNLNILSQATVPFTVYDVSVNINGEVVAVGAEQDNSATNRFGKIQSVDMSACAQFALVCCDANICPVDPLCVTDSPVTLVPSTTGGTWSGTGVNATTGVFNPATAGSGTHTITYTLPCGSDEVIIQVNPCIAISVCYDGINLVATGGTGTIIWESWVTISTPINNEQQCIDCPFTDPIYFMGFYVDCSDDVCSGTGWSQIGTGTTIVAPASWPLQISDNNGVVLTYNNLSEIPPCSACTPPTLTTITTSPTCAGGSNGAINLTITGSSTYTVLWSNSQTSEDLANLTAGTYSVTVTDAVNPACIATATITVSSGAALPTPTITGAASACQGNSTTLNAGAGYSSYLWSGNQTSQTISVNSTGVYSVTVTNASGCTGTSQMSFTIIPLPTANAGPDQTICNATSTTLNASGGTSFVWSNGATNQSVTVSPLVNTIYYVTVTDNGCSSTDSVIVYLSSTLVVTTTADPATVCSGGSTNLEANGGTIFAWSTGGSTQVISVSPVSNTTYFVTVSDANGCSGIGQVNVDVTPYPTADAGSDQTICSNSNATLVASGGSSYLWSTGETTQSINVIPSTTTTYSVTVSNNGCDDTDQIIVTINSGISASITTTLPSICEGQSTQLQANGGTLFLWNTGETIQTIDVSPPATTNYSVTVSDANGCTGIGQIQINVDDSVTITVSPSTICEGESAQLTASGGTSYIWSTGETQQTISVSPTSTTDYSVTVSNTSCTASALVTVIVYDQPIADAGPNLTICAGDQATIVATGGVSYEWSNGTMNSIINVSPTTSTSYSVTVNSNGCTDTDVVAVTVNPLPQASAGADITTCNGDIQTLTATGGGSYLWSTGGTSQTITVSPTTTTIYTVTVTALGCSSTDGVLVSVNAIPDADAGPDQAICPGGSATLVASGGTSYFWSTMSSSPSITVSPAQTTTYVVTVTDNNCSLSDTVVVSVGSSVSASISASPSIICETQTSDLTATGGTDFLWSTGETTQVITVSPSADQIFYVTVTSNGCIDSTDILITVNPNITATSSPTTICEGETALLTVSAGSVYLWSTGETTQSIQVSPTSTTIYHVTVSVSTCIDSTEVPVYVNSLPAADAGADQSICDGSFVTLTATGGATYVWSNSVGGATIILVPQYSSVYYVTTTDASGCTDTDNVFVSIDPVPNAYAGSNQHICQGSSVQLNASGGFTYSWSPGTGLSSVSIANPLATLESTQLYTVTVTDQNGCTDISSVLVTVSPSLLVDVSINTFPGNSVCLGEQVSFTAVTTNAGQNPVHQWKVNNLNVGTNSPFYSASNLADGDVVSCILTSSESCVTNNPAVAFSQINIFPIPKIYVNFSNNKGCMPLPVHFQVSSLISGTYLWNLGDGATSTDSNFIHTYNNPGNYDVSVTITSLDGCTNTVSYMNAVRVYGVPDASFYADPVSTSLIEPVVSFINLSVGSIVDICAFGDGDTSVVLGGDNFTHIFEIPGNFNSQLVAYSSEGCSDTAWIQVLVRPFFTFYAPSAFVPSSGQNNIFYVTGTGISHENFHLYIYDRWGELIFETLEFDGENPENRGWDGRVKGNFPAPVGVYTWLVQYMDDSGEMHEERGSVTVIR